MKYYASLSYGKDSLAMLEAIHLLNYPLDGIIHSEVWATDSIQGDLPEMIEFKKHADAIIKKKYGHEVKHIYRKDSQGNKMTYESGFYRVRKNNPERGIYGFPFQRGRWCTSDLKTKALEKATRNCNNYVGIAADETNRIIVNKKNNKLLPLVDIGWTEEDCMKWCEENDLVSPLYKKRNRGVLVLFFTKSWRFKNPLQ